jgi:hypothetical protein
MHTLIIVIVGVIAVFGFYWLVAAVVRHSERQWMRRHGRAISWTHALERVRHSNGYFIIGTSGEHREIVYVDGAAPNDAVSAHEAYRQRAVLVEGYPGRPVVADLQAQGVVGRCIELNVDALGV